MNRRDRPLRVLVAGLGQMGKSHALAYHHNADFDIVGLFNRGPIELPAELSACPRVDSFDAGLALRPDVVSINTYTDSHAALAVQAMRAGAHVFVEKPLALTLESAQTVIDAARDNQRKLVIGYILRHHPAWAEFIRAARELGAPYVMRMNLNQPSVGAAWEVHKRLMHTTPPIVDCGVHYVDIMCQITDARPVQVRGMGVRLSPEIAADQVNYGHLQLLFEDGSLGWYEAGWGLMMSQTASIVKDVIGAKGAVSLVMGDETDAADIENHTKAGQLRLHSVEYGAGGAAAGSADAWVPMREGVSHQWLCDQEQAFLADAIRADTDLGQHHQDALRSLRIVLAAEQSMRERRAIDI
jgi:predicted dehydrogenase